MLSDAGRRLTSGIQRLHIDGFIQEPSLPLLESNKKSRVYESNDPIINIID